MNGTTDGVQSELPEHGESINKEVVNSSLPVEEKKKFVYASLPSIGKECRWWVVELDQERFTDLVYYSEKRALSFSMIKKAVFNAEYNNSLVKFVLTNPISPFEDKFGAYVVSGQKHVIFFGPYGLSETHGITAIKNEDGKSKFVPFTSKFSKSENFKSLGINMAPIKDSCQSVLKAVSAAWWYSTGKRGTINNVAESINKPALISSVTSCNKDRITYGNEKNALSKQQGIECDLHDTVEAIEDDITIEQDLIKMEPFEYYENSILYSSASEISTNVHTRSNKDMESFQIDPQLKIVNVGSVTGNVIDKTNTVRTPIVGQITPSVNNRSLLKTNVATLKTSTVIINPPPPVCLKSILPKKRKQKSSGSRFYKPKKLRKIICKDDSFERKLKKELKKIEEEIMSKKLEASNKVQASQNIPDTDFDSDSSSLSDEDIYVRDDTVLSVDEQSSVQRIIHKRYKDAANSTEVCTFCILYFILDVVLV